MEEAVARPLPRGEQVGGGEREQVPGLSLLPSAGDSPGSSVVAGTRHGAGLASAPSRSPPAALPSGTYFPEPLTPMSSSAGSAAMAPSGSFRRLQGPPASRARRAEQHAVGTVIPVAAPGLPARPRPR